MTLQLKSLNDMKSDLEARGCNVKEWATQAGIHWQALYRKLAKPEGVTVGEHIRLQEAAEELRKTKKRKGNP